MEHRKETAKLCFARQIIVSYDLHSHKTHSSFPVVRKIQLIYNQTQNQEQKYINNQMKKEIVQYKEVPVALVGALGSNENP